MKLEFAVIRWSRLGRRLAVLHRMSWELHFDRVFVGSSAGKLTVGLGDPWLVKAVVVEVHGSVR